MGQSFAIKGRCIGGRHAGHADRAGSGRCDATRPGRAAAGVRPERSSRLGGVGGHRLLTLAGRRLSGAGSASSAAGTSASPPAAWSRVSTDTSGSAEAVTSSSTVLAWRMRSMTFRSRIWVVIWSRQPFLLEPRADPPGALAAPLGHRLDLDREVLVVDLDLLGLGDLGQQEQLLERAAGSTRGHWRGSRPRWPGSRRRRSPPAGARVTRRRIVLASSRATRSEGSSNGRAGPAAGRGSAGGGPGAAGPGSAASGRPAPPRAAPRGRRTRSSSGTPG